jgi:hypothetical protein
MARTVIINKVNLNLDASLRSSDFEIGFRRTPEHTTAITLSSPTNRCLRLKTNVRPAAQPRAPRVRPHPTSVMHPASNPHDPRFRNPCALFPIFVLLGTLRAPQPPPCYTAPHMAAKNRTKKGKATLDSVLSTVKRGFADLEGKMDRSFAAVADDIADIKSKMATKDDIADLRREMATKDDINRLDTKLTKFEENEIDKRLQLEVRVTAIEKHLDLDKKIAA